MTRTMNKWALLNWLGMVLGLSAHWASAATPQRIVMIDTDDSPGNTYIDILQADDGTLTSLIYEASPSLTFSLQQMQTQTAVLKQQSGKNIIQLKLEQPFDPIHGGHVIVQFLNNGIKNSYRDFRILIDVQGTAITFRSDPDPNDPQSDKNQFTSVFNKLFMWKNTIFGKEIGINHVSPSLIPASDVTNGPAPLVMSAQAR